MKKIRSLAALAICVFALCFVSNSMANFPDRPLRKDSIPGVQKLKDIMIYEDPQHFYSSFPSIVGKRPNGELLLAFRRAPDRKVFGEGHTDHVDPNSYLVSLGLKMEKTGQRIPELIYAHPFGECQDPCLLQLRDGTVLCTSYGWAFLRPDGMANLKKPYFLAAGAVSRGLSGSFKRLEEGIGRSRSIHHIFSLKLILIPWAILFRPITVEPFMKARAEESSGQLQLAMLGKTSVHLINSDDKGLTWNYSAPVAVDDKVSFNETSVYETPKGDILAFLKNCRL